MKAFDDLAQQAAALRELHHADRPLLLPNAWDAASARLVEAAGFPVIATSSGAVAASLGFEDSDSMPPAEAFAAIGRVSRSVDRPVTADIEAGYRLEPEELVAQLLGAGAVGCNLEDTDHHGQRELIDVEAQSERIAAMSRSAKTEGVDIVINGRVDVSLREDISAKNFDEAVGRAKAYLAAGAGSVYPINLSDERYIGEFVERVQAPVNIMFGRRSPSLARLAELGVARVSLAGNLMRRAYGDLHDALGELRASWEELSTPPAD